MDRKKGSSKHFINHQVNRICWKLCFVCNRGDTYYRASQAPITIVPTLSEKLQKLFWCNFCDSAICISFIVISFHQILLTWWNAYSRWMKFSSFFRKRKISEESSSQITNIISNFRIWKIVSIENIRHLIKQSQGGRADKLLSFREFPISSGLTKTICKSVNVTIIVLHLGIAYPEKMHVRSSTCPLTGFFWLLSHVMYLKLSIISVSSFSILQNFDFWMIEFTKIPKQNLCFWHLAIWFKSKHFLR